MGERVRVPDLIRMRQQGEKIVMLTAYDYTFARLFDEVGVPLLLVGDSLATVVQGEQNTLPVTLEQMIYHTRLVAGAVQHALVIADMPFMSYQVGPKEALCSAGRLIQEARASAVKLEGGTTVHRSIAKIVRAGIPVMAHIGLTPQSYHALGGHRVQGRTAQSAEQLLEDARAVEEAGAFAILIEAVPAYLAEEITEMVSVPTIGIGAGPGCSGQVLVMHDMLGLTSGGNRPKFVKAYANLAQEVRNAVKEFTEEVRSRKFPSTEHCYSGKTQGSAVVNLYQSH